jgi:hypothetical protein
MNAARVLICATFLAVGAGPAFGDEPLDSPPESTAGVETTDTAGRNSPYPYRASIDYNQNGVVDESDLARASQNPVADLISLPLQNNFLFQENTGNLIYNLNVQPVVPFNLSEDWNLITRTILPVLALENAPPGSDSAGLGDLTASFFFSPADSGGLIWGVGPILAFPTATDDLFGAGQWSAGPTAVALTMHGPWVFGALANNLWSYAGDSSRPAVNAFLVQPFINYNLDGGWFLTTGPIITADWNASGSERWTVPLGAGFGRIFPIGRQPVNLSLQAYYNIERPTGGPEWSLRFNLQLLFPR